MAQATPKGGSGLILGQAPRAFTVYCALYGGEGEGTISLVVSKWPEEKDVYRYQRWTAFSNTDDYTDLEIPVRKCCFPETGRYSFQLRFEEHLLGQRFVEVRKERS